MMSPMSPTSLETSSPSQKPGPLGTDVFRQVDGRSSKMCYDLVMFQAVYIKAWEEI